MVAMADYRDKALLIVNVASRCMFTRQYDELEALYKKYGPRGFAVLAFPCNQFLRQEPGTESEIDDFCKLTYKVTFPMFAKVDVNGPNTHPIFDYLKTKRPGILGLASVKWNFTKFLLDKKGDLIWRFAPSTPPGSLGGDIDRLLR